MNRASIQLLLLPGARVRSELTWRPPFRACATCVCGQTMRSHTETERHKCARAPWFAHDGTRVNLTSFRLTRPSVCLNTHLHACVSRVSGRIFIPVRASQRQQQSADAGLRGPGMAAFDNLIYTPWTVSYDAPTCRANCINYCRLTVR